MSERVDAFPDILAACIEALEQGDASIPELLAKYPEHEAPLAQLLVVAQMLMATPTVVPSAAFCQVARDRLLTAIDARAGQLEEALVYRENLGVSADALPPPQFDGETELVGLLNVVQEVQAGAALRPSAAFRASARSRLLSKLEPLPVQETIPVGGRRWPERLAAVQAAAQRVRPRLPAWWMPRLPVRAPRFAATLLAVVAFICVLGSGIFFASGRAVPGDPLYAAKMGTEAFRLALSSDALTTGQLHLTFASERLIEIRGLVERGEADEAGEVLRRYQAHLLAAEFLMQSAPDPETRRLLAELLHDVVGEHEVALVALELSVPDAEQAVLTVARASIDSGRVAAQETLLLVAEGEPSSPMVLHLHFAVERLRAAVSFANLGRSEPTIAALREYAGQMEAVMARVMGTADPRTRARLAAVMLTRLEEHTQYLAAIDSQLSPDVSVALRDARASVTAAQTLAATLGGEPSEPSPDEAGEITPTSVAFVSPTSTGDSQSFSTPSPPPAENNTATPPTASDGTTPSPTTSLVTNTPVVTATPPGTVSPATPTSTPSMTPAASPTSGTATVPTATSVADPSVTPSITNTPETSPATPTPTGTAWPTTPPTATPTAAPSSTNTPLPVPTATPTVAATATPMLTATAVPTVTPVPVPSVTHTWTPVPPTATIVPTATPLPTATATPTQVAGLCVQSQSCFTVTSYGYVSNADGTTSISFQATNQCQNDVGYFAIGTDSWTRLAPAAGSQYQSNLGPYNVVWTGDSGNPGFTSIKFESQFNGFSNGASDLFTVLVSGFVGSTPIQVQGNAGSTTETFSFTLDACQ